MKLLRKIAPLAVAGVLLGASFAAAADLANWRANFPGADTAVIFHRSADAMAVSDIVAALGTSAGGQAPTGEAHLIKASGNDLNYGEDLFDIEDTLEKRDLPLILADGRYKETRGKTDNDVDYEQYLIFDDNTGTMVFEKNTETTTKKVDTYLKFDDLATTEAFRYRLVFENPVEFDSTDVDKDFELTKLKMLGREYFIVDATAEDVGGGVMEINSLTLMGGALKASQWEYSTASYVVGGKTYEVKVKIISDDDSTAVLVVNGEETDELAEGDTYVLEDDTRLGILDVIPNEGAEMTGEEAVGNDLVTFYLGAEKIEFKQGDEVEINGEAVEGSEVDLQTAASHEKLAEINLWVIPNDDIFLAKGEEYTDPILGRFKITYQGLLSDTETIDVATSGDDGTITLTNVAEDELEIPVVLDDSTSITYPGDELWTGGVTTVQDGNAGLGNLLIADGDSCTGTASVEECEGTYLLVVGTGGEARILEITEIDTTKKEVSLREVSPNPSNSWPDRNYDTDPVHIVLGFATIDIDVAGTTITAADINTCGSACAAGDFVTSLGAEVDLEFDGANTNVYLFTDDGDDLTGGDLVGPDPVLQFIDDGTGDMIIDPDSVNNLEWTTEEKDSDYDVAIDRYDVATSGVEKWGAIFKYNTKDDDEMTIVYPEEEAVHKVYVSEITATIPELTPGYAAGAAIGVYDTDVRDVADMNHISVGGSAINSYSAELLGLDYPTYGSDPEWQSATGVNAMGKAIIKIMNNPYAEGKYAMLVAGWEDVDTARAAKALRYNTPALSGTSVLLDTTTETVTRIS